MMVHKSILCIVIIYSLALLVGANDVNRRRIHNNLLQQQAQEDHSNLQADAFYFSQVSSYINI